MKKFSLFLVASSFLVPALAFAQEAAAAAPAPADDMAALVSLMIAAAQGGQWSVFASLVIMILVFLATKVEFIDKLIPADVKPWVAAIAGVLASVAASAFSDGNWGKAIMSGLVTGAAASGLWELVGKRVLGPKA